MNAFTAIADPVRRDLLGRLARGPVRVVDLAAGQGVSRPAISRHLRVLGEAGLVVAEDVGRERHYRLERSGLAPVTAWLVEMERKPQPQPRFDESVLDALELEVRRTARERSTSETRPTEETA
ncbi:MAG: Transcriptional regulator, ArsR family [uncultured Nocardioides sp.]|uniref:Transcriptional regulator, ArsR family n=1 Tax=uncultured Nocardioides sp. TaxID=198441 RepID=A0A6J4NP56_9ACTN|nr:MAG: Transcriptional regulator, ArsR family [uncultured Nocardioides sp.]